MKKFLFLLISLIVLTSCVNRTPEVIEALQIGSDYITADENCQLVFLDATTFAILDSNQSATVKGLYTVRKINSRHYSVNLEHITSFDVRYDKDLQSPVFRQTIHINGKLFYSNNLMCE